MNFNKFINSDYLKNNPLCGIDTYKDELNLATGACTRQIKKYEFTGTESGYVYYAARRQAVALYVTDVEGGAGTTLINALCTHYVRDTRNNLYNNTAKGFSNSSEGGRIIFFDTDYQTLASFQAFLKDQYDAGTPVCVWYVLSTPTTETITVPSGLSGTEEGYLNQSGTPTPTNPIYPTANTVEKWFDINHYIMGTSTDTITTLPADIYADGNNATVGISGNMEQNGTPTPDNPIQPQGTGERTGNLFDKNTAVYGEYINEDGTITHEDIEKTAWLSDYIPVTAGLMYTLNKTGSRRGKFYKADKTPYQTATMDFSGLENKNTFTIPEPVAYIRFTIYKGVATPDVVMLNTGSTPLPYEPYGYEIPISSAGQTNPVYLGEVETTRRIKKLVFDGTEEWERTGYPEYNAYFRIPRFTIAQAGNVVCSHYVSPDTNISVSNTVQGAKIQNSTELIRVLIVRPPEWRTWNVDDFKAYLAAQYAAGTPVTVWYVLVTPETGIVNEPIRKIGNYADTVSGITIPTIAGADSFDVETTLKPSEVELTYTGWHDATVQEWDGSQWNE